MNRTVLVLAAGSLVVDVIAVAAALVLGGPIAVTVLLLVAIATGTALVLVLFGTRAPVAVPSDTTAGDEPPVVVPPGTVAGDGLLERIDEERQQLMLAMIAVRDSLVDGTGGAFAVDEALRSVGVDPFQVDGEVFDAARHRAVDREETDDASLVGRVASTEERGYRDHGRVVRLPGVVVYRARS